MAYLDHKHSHKRLAGVTGVALVHIVLALGLTAGLAIDYIRPAPPPPLIGGQIKLPPPQPTETPEPTTRTQEPVVRDTYIDPPITISDPIVLPPLPQDPPTDVATYTSGPVITLPTAPPTQPPQPPLVAPRGPIPANGPAGWVTTEDYPRVALTREYEGTVTYRVDVGSNGRVQVCSVVASSGYEILDRAACSRIESRARFRPATDRYGEQVAGTYRGSVSWQIPD